MRKLYFLMFLFAFTGMAYAQPEIQDPTPLVACDTLNDGFEVFDLTVKIPEILGSLNPAVHHVSFHETLTSAQLLGGPEIPNPAAFVNLVSSGQTVWVRVVFDVDGSFSITSLDLVLNPTPVVGPVFDLFMEDIPYDGFANFDLTVNEIALLNGAPNIAVTYHLDYADAQSGENHITTPTFFVGSEGQLIFARLFDPAGGCASIASFHLRVTNPDYVFIPDFNFKSKLISGQNARDLNNITTIVDTNGDSQIQFTEAANISHLNLNNAGITDFTGLEAFTNLTGLFMSGNLVPTIDLSALPLLQSHVAIGCGLTSVDYSNQPNLRVVDCSGNNLTSLNFSANPLLIEITCRNNGLTSLDLSGLSNLNYLDCQFNQIDSLDTAGCGNLSYLKCHMNEMTYLDVSQSPLLATLDCAANTLVTLDLSQNPLLCELSVYENLNMEWLNIKNGVDGCFTAFEVSFITTNPMYFCCDENEVNYFRNLFIANNEINVNVNSYCSFAPGGDFNTINTSISFDSDNNGCDANDRGLYNVRVNINDQTNTGSSFTDANGETYFYTQAGNFTVTPALENPSWFNVSPPSATIPFSNSNNNSVLQNFCISPVGMHPDLEIVIVPRSPARPGFDAYYDVVVKNKGNQAITNTFGILFMYDFNRMTFVEASEPLILIEGPQGTLRWELLNFLPFESKAINVRFVVNTPTHPNYPVNNGDILTFNATANPVEGDETPADNVFQFNHTVINSFDPNEIICLEGNVVSPTQIGNYLHYTINFENTGTAPAENIVVREIIDPNQFDIGTLQLLNSSASVSTRIMGNIVEYIFPSINLHSGGHGNILLKMRSNNGLVEGNSVSRTANIYFDYNFPVATDPEDTVFRALSNPGIPVDASISVYPNPTNGIVNINCANSIKSVQLYDVQGRILQTNLVNQNQTVLDITNQLNGVYFVKIISDQGMGVKKIVRE
ncbi:DUF7619 domain-containing protein [Flavobacterium sp.]